MTSLTTKNPTALRYFMEETLYPVQITGKTETQQIAEKAPVGYHFLGGNSKHILFLVRNKAHAFFSPTAHEAFLKTIQALALSLEDVAVFNTSTTAERVDMDRICSFFQPKIFVVAGPISNDLGLPDYPLNTPTHQDGIKLLYTFSFEEMLTDTQKKKLFWQAIKTL
ncbi:hypothetical protein GCM10023231_08400 [Olivibacter ginsenosidimutans]|uniref:Uncharacterized protein n=1 Tax=Olivibacter ginsenosidimutans TaxID=1176537 RepID=A0ABP9AL78_9SPHI